ncbi:hypothetical protein CXG81DRAFT_17762 [Caulochytrium protostelioides]|uniref:Uncharacterized protein n=1 Tax=Caulochytrium protostelioides TaxID=1555241 RepID=A0A4P9X231_9FUNG|nr:hypothetical protein CAUPRSCDRAFT_10351 [Caulochytrium protostelioides]RKP02624.1 hypothetical protein CXG81DRAFT_17762 [Caulochytrium protostelioides]|eukprot:RKP02624.1 hypothetical protein CXG81DRAFT_17762 [Caulochytrium protostelioides]
MAGPIAALRFSLVMLLICSVMIPSVLAVPAPLTHVVPKPHPRTPTDAREPDDFIPPVGDLLASAASEHVQLRDVPVHVPSEWRRLSADVDAVGRLHRVSDASSTPVDGVPVPGAPVDPLSRETLDARRAGRGRSSGRVDRAPIANTASYRIAAPFVDNGDRATSGAGNYELFEFEPLFPNAVDAYEPTAPIRLASGSQVQQKAHFPKMPPQMPPSPPAASSHFERPAEASDAPATTSATLAEASSPDAASASADESSQLPSMKQDTLAEKPGE